MQHSLASGIGWRGSGGARSSSRRPSAWWTSASPCSLASPETTGSATSYLCWPNTLGNHTFRATGITAYLKNGETLEKAAMIANHASTRTTQLYDRRSDEVSLDEVERILI